MLCSLVYCSVYHSIISIYNCQCLIYVLLYPYMYIYCLFVDLYIGLSVFIILSNVCDVLFLMECFSLPPCLHTYVHTGVYVCVDLCVCVRRGRSLSPLSLNIPGSRTSTASAGAVLTSSSSSRTRHHKSLSTSAHPCPADLHSHRPRQVPTPPKREPNRKPVMSITEECHIK